MAIDINKSEQLKQDFEVYRFYMNFILQVAMFVFAITGGIVSYYLAHIEQSLMHYSLFIPLLFSVAVSGICFWGLDSAGALIDDQDALAESAGVELAYDMRPLRYLLVLFGVLFALVAIGVGFLFGRAIL